MAVGLLLLCLTGLVTSKEPPDVKCVVINLDYVHCMWNGSATTEVNHTFYSRFGSDFKECDRYVLENGMVVGCDHPYDNLSTKRFVRFHTKLMMGDRSSEKNHELKSKVKLNAPFNLTVKNGTDGNLWYYWNDTCNFGCTVSEVHHRIRGQKWKSALVHKNSYHINLPSSSHVYELQVRTNLAEMCAQSDFWSDWSPPVFWLTESGTVSSVERDHLRAQTTMVLTVGSVIFIGLVFILVKHRRLKVILIPILPDPSKNLTKILADGNIENWLPISKSIKEGFNANYNERACSVREYSLIAQTTSESSVDQSSSGCGSCASLTATKRTDSSVSLPDN